MPIKDSSTAAVDSSLPNKLHKYLRLRIIAGLIITSSLIGSATIFLLYSSQTKQLETELSLEIELQTIALESELSRLQNITTQITSRTYIREKLEKYLQEEIELEALINLSRPILADAMQKTDDVVGINRLDNDGNPLIQVGDPIPNTLWPKKFLTNTVQLGKPQTSDERQLLVLSAPIFNRQGIKVGIDIVAFDSKRINEIIQRFTQRRQPPGNILIATSAPDNLVYFSDSDKVHDTNITHLIHKEVNNALQSNDNRLHFINNSQEIIVIAHQEIENSDWVYIFFDTTDNLYSSAKLHAMLVAIAIIILTLVGILLTLRLVRPLPGQISVESDTMRQLLHEHKELLNQAQDSKARLQSILDNTTLVIHLKDLDGKYLLVNKRFENLFHLTQQEIIGKTDHEIFPKDIADKFRANDIKVTEMATALELDEQAPHDDGIHNYISTKFPLYNLAGEIYCTCGISADITERKQIIQREKVRLNILEMVAQGTPMHDTLDTLVRLVESEMPDTLCSILIIDETGDHLRVAAAPSFPDFYNEAIDGMSIGTGLGSCGTTAYENKTTIVEDIQQHPYWEQFAELAARAGLAACWSDPILDSQGQVLGTIAMYYRIPRAPKNEEVTLINQMTQLAGIVIERNANEQALRHSEEQLRTEKDFVNAIVEAAGPIVMVLDRNSCVVRFNHIAEKATGYSFEEIKGRPIWDFLIPPETINSCKNLFNELISGVEMGSHENELLLKDGSRRLFDLHNSLLKDAHGEVNYIVSKGYDITEARSSQRSLNEHKNELESLVAARTEKLEEITAYNRTLFETSPVGLLLCSMDGNLIDINPYYLDIIGYTEAEAKNLTYWDLTPKEYSSQEQEQLRSLETTGHYGPYEKEYIHKDGHRVPVLLNGLLIERNNTQYIWSSVEDISERKLMENTLRTSETNLAHAQEIAHLGSWYLDILNDRLSWSNETYRIFGLELNSTISFESFIQCLHPDEVNYVRSSWEEAMLGKPYDIEHRIIVDGKEKWVRQQARVQFNENGKAYSCLGTVQDISELKKITQATQEALTEAHRLAKVRSEFVANMSHELRTPLNAVLGLAKIGERGVTTDTSEEKIRETFGLISDSGQHLLRLVDDILDFSKIEAGKLVLENQPFDLRNSIDNVTSMIRGQVEDKGLIFIVDIADELPSWVMGDALRLEQILLNLLSNAVKFTEKGEVRLQAQGVDNKVQIQVIDTGIGMSDAQLDQLFKPFEQADTSTTRRFGGTGLGLAISKNLAGMMRGDISVKTCFNVGSEFILTLPLAQTKPASKPQKPMPFNKGKRLQGINILAAEDVELNRMVLNDMLGLEGAQITFGDDGLQALNLLKEANKNTFDIVLMDIQMPVMDGYEATQEMLKLYPNLPIIGLTAHALSEVKDRCLEVGMVDHITKPVDLDNLVMAIQRHTSSNATTDLSAKDTTEINDITTTLETSPESDTIIDWSALHERYKEHDSIIKTLATTFVSSYKETPSEIRHAIHAKDSAALSSIAHGMKGSAGYLEAHQLHQLASLTEAQVKQNDTNAYITGEKLAIAIEQLSDALKEVTG